MRRCSNWRYDTIPYHTLPYQTTIGTRGYDFHQSTPRNRELKNYILINFSLARRPLPSPYALFLPYHSIHFPLPSLLYPSHCPQFPYLPPSPPITISTSLFFPSLPHTLSLNSIPPPLSIHTTLVWDTLQAQKLHKVSWT